MTTKINKKSTFYANIVRQIANQSKDKRLKVGAILFKDDRIVATGYNGQVSGAPHKAVMFNGHDISTIHAEQNIIAFCAKHGISTKNTEMLITHSPCHICTKIIAQSGISKVWYLEEYKIEDNPFLIHINLEKLDDGS